MKIVHLIFLTGLIVFSGCRDHTKVESNLAQQVVDKAIEVVGGEQFKNAVIEFDFRDRHYKAIRNKWKFQYERIWSDSLNHYRDLISNSGYLRYINDSLTKVPDTMARKYSRSINGVHYFSILPFSLNDKAVNKNYLGEIEINGKTYHKIEVTFDKEGGGEDYEDIFVYWIDINTFEVDYLAYSYDQGPKDRGMRLRQAISRSKVNGLTFTDYNNYKPTDSLAKVYDLDLLFMANELQLLSKIELENITVSLLPTADR